MGIDAYLEEQLHPELLDDAALESRLSEFGTLTMSPRSLVDQYFRPANEARRRQAARQTEAGGQMPPEVSAETRRVLAAQRNVLSELTQAKMLRAALSERQLEEVLVDFWLNHFNVFAGKGQVRQYLTSYERDVIRPHVLGNFGDMLRAVARSPAMLFYLDNWQSAAPRPAIPPDLERRMNSQRLTPEQRRRLLVRAEQRQAGRQRPQRGLNENYARELMELHTLGVDGGYSQQDVVELARVLTGWTIDQPRDGGSFVFQSAMHDTGTKTLLGETFGPVGEVEGLRALDLLASHRSTARHIAFKLAQRFVADEPPSSVVDRAADVFEATSGDLRAVVRSIITSPEFRDPKSYRAKIKTPLEFVVSAVRVTGATVRTAQPLVTAMENLAMPLYRSQPPTGYSVTAESWVNTGALIARMNFASALVEEGRVLPTGRTNGRVPRPEGGTLGALGRPAGQGRPRPGPLRVNVSRFAPDTSDASRDRVVALLLAGEVSETTLQTLARAESPESLLVLALGSPEFQRR